MSLLSDFFKGSRKVNLTPDVVPLSPSQVNPEMYGNLSKLATKYISGSDTGFGDQFVDKATNPVADAARRNYRNVTAPTISSNYSARGLGRSNLAANAQGLAEGNVESDISQLMAHFYTLNEAQKKTDTQFGANLGSNILNNDTAAQHAKAAASEKLANATAADARGREAANNAKAQQFGQAAVALGAAPFTGGASLALFGIPGLGGKSAGSGTGASSLLQTPSTTRIAGSSGLSGSSPADFEAWLTSFLGG